MRTLTETNKYRAGGNRDSPKKEQTEPHCCHSLESPQVPSMELPGSAGCWTTSEGGSGATSWADVSGSRRACKATPRRGLVTGQPATVTI